MNLRKGIYVFILSFLILTLGCVPKSTTMFRPGSPEDLPGCNVMFPAGSWESVHKIEANFGGGSSFLIGVTKGEASEGRFESILLTPEGFVLFDAERRVTGFSIRKAVAPFDSQAFARGLIEDVSLLFLPPAGKPITWGKEANGKMICKWENPEHSTEIMGLMENGWQIVRRDRYGDVTKEVFLSGPFLNGVASRIEFRAFQPATYTLKMSLIQSNP